MMITLTEWAKILTSLHNNDEERKVALLALADELPEEGGKVLREHTCNVDKKCIKPVMHYQYNKLGKSKLPCWISSRWTTWESWLELTPGVVAVYIFEKLKSKKEAFCKFYDDEELAWEDLLRVLESM